MIFHAKYIPLESQVRDCPTINLFYLIASHNLSQNSSHFTNAQYISEAAPLTYGLPQGSCVGPGLFPIYTLPLGDIIKRHNLEYHCYADDTQIFLSIDPEQADVHAALQRIETCIDDVRTWMNQNFLKLNDSKTEFMVLGSKAQIEKVDIEHIRVGESYIVPATSVCNLGVIIDSNLTMECLKQCLKLPSAQSEILAESANILQGMQLKPSSMLLLHQN